MTGALAGVRVVDLTDDTGRFGTKLLAEAGADVVRVATSGSPGAPMRDPAAAAVGGVLDWWLDAGKRRLPLDLHRTADVERFRALVGGADVLIETEPPGRLARLGLGPEDLRAVNPALVHVSLTPFGQDGPRAGWQVSDLVSQALGGFLSVTGLPDAPLSIWGRQTGNVGGFYAAICALAGLHVARLTGQGQHVDLSLHEGVISCTEQVLMEWAFPHVFANPIAPRQGSRHWSNAFEVMPCRTGAAMLTLAGPLDQLFAWWAADGMLPDLSEVDMTDLAAVVPLGMAHLRTWAQTKDARPLIEEAQTRHLPWGDVRDVDDVAALPQHLARGFFRRVEAPGGAPGGSVHLPGPIIRHVDTPAPAPAPPLTVDDVTWPARPTEATASGATGSAATVPSASAPLDGIRVLDFTWVLAGPFCTRILGDLGADVVRVQTQERAVAAHDPSHPYFVMWGRNKRSVALHMKHEGALAVARRLIEQCDVLVENFSANVLSSWGLDWETVRAWNPKLVYLTMSGCGHDGPWKDYVSYAPTVHAFCGLTALTNPPGRQDLGTGMALNDHASGLAGAMAVLAALEARRRSGRGQHIDLSQLEVGTYLVGPAILDRLANGRTAVAVGNRDAFDDPVPNEVYPAADGWVAVTCRDDRDWQRLCAAVDATVLSHDASLRSVEQRRERRAAVDAALGAWARARPADEAMRILQAAGVPCGKVQDASDMFDADEQLAHRAWVEEVEHFAHGRHFVDRFPARFSSSALEAHRPSPYLGEHNFEVYGELLGMTDEEVAAAMGDHLFS